MHSLDDHAQRVHHIHRGEIVTLRLPAPHQRLTRTKLAWGDACSLMTPAFWAAQSWMWELEEPEHYRLGRTIEEELMACLLGGHGIPAEVGLAAYERLRHVWRESPEHLTDETAVTRLLSEPLTVGKRAVRYRFAAQKARYLALALIALPRIDLDQDDRALRDALCSLKADSPKTASWIVRNWRGSDEVAILDIHLLRAGRQLGLFTPELSVERHYLAIESAFVDFARDIGAKASILDSVIWMAFRSANRVTRQAAARPAPVEPRQDQFHFALH